MPTWPRATDTATGSVWGGLQRQEQLGIKKGIVTAGAKYEAFLTCENLGLRVRLTV